MSGQWFSWCEYYGSLQQISSECKQKSIGMPFALRTIVRINADLKARQSSKIII